jgi:hypothetical protein
VSFEVLDDTENFQPRYDISPEEVEGLCAEFLSNREVKAESQFGCYQISGTDRFSNMGRFIERVVFEEEFNNTDDIMQEEYGPYEENSTFLVVVDHEKSMPIGVLRVIEHSDDTSIKSLVDLEKSPLQISPELFYEAYGTTPEKCVEAGTIAVLENYRGSKANYLPTLLMLRSLYISVISDPRFEYIVNIIDLKAEKRLRDLKLPFRPILDTEPFSYLGSTLSRAVYAKSAEFYPQVNYWQKKYEQESQEEQDSRKALLAAGMKALKDGDFIDEMLAPEIIDYTRLNP